MIELINIAKKYNKIVVMDGASWVFEKGTKTSLMGPSGSGKTTLLNIISGLISIDEGMIKIDGVITDTPKISIHPSRRKLGFAFQFPSLWPHLTVKRNIIYGLADLDKEERQARYEAITKEFEIQDLGRKYPGEISGGQAKRASLARTLITNPEYLLLDEPLNNLDKYLKHKVLDIIRTRVLETNATLIYVTHDLKETESICNMACGIEDKKIITMDVIN